jgi:hypothetical protein
MTRDVCYAKRVGGPRVPSLSTPDEAGCCAGLPLTNIRVFQVREGTSLALQRSSQLSVFPDQIQCITATDVLDALWSTSF